MVKLGLMVQRGDRYLSLAVRKPRRERESFDISDDLLARSQSAEIQRAVTAV